MEPGLGAGESVVEGVDQCAISRQIFGRRGLPGAEAFVDQFLALAGERAQFREAEGEAGAGKAMEMALQFLKGGRGLGRVTQAIERDAERDEARFGALHELRDECIELFFPG